MVKAFISYSHRDVSALQQLHTHLAELRREGNIEAWFDREILAGGEIDTEIAEQLEACELILMLISPNFLASDYCVKREMRRALERHGAKQARVIPIIIKPCDWALSPLRKLKALPRDAKPVSEWRDENSAYLNIVEEIRRVLCADDDTDRIDTTSNGSLSVEVSSQARHRRVKRNFNEIEKSNFQQADFKAIRDYFGRKISEIDSIDGLRGYFSLLSKDSFTCTLTNQACDQGIAHITAGRRRAYDDFDIFYACIENATDGSLNGDSSIEADGYALFMDPVVFSYEYGENRLAPETVAKMLWVRFLEKAGVTYD